MQGSLGTALETENLAYEPVGDEMRRKNPEALLQGTLFVCCCVCCVGLLILALPGSIDDASSGECQTLGAILTANTDDMHITQHASCRMQCRKVTKEDVVATIKTGCINPEKTYASNRHGSAKAGCQKYVLEHDSTAGCIPGLQCPRRLRVVISDCAKIKQKTESKIAVITVIRLKEKHPCPPWNCGGG